MLGISHRTPRTRDACELLADSGASIFEIDVRAVNGEIAATHFVPFIPGLPGIERDGRRIRLRGSRTMDATLADVSGLVPENVGILLDLKDDRPGNAPALTKLLLAAIGEPERYIVSSKNWASLTAFRNAGFRTLRSVATRRALRKLLAGGPVSDYGVTVRHTFITSVLIAELQQLSTKVFAWTINDVDRAAELQRLGVAGISTDSPDVLRLLRAFRQELPPEKAVENEG